MCEFTDLQKGLVEQGVLNEGIELQGWFVNIELAQQVIDWKIESVTTEWREIIRNLLYPLSIQLQKDYLSC